MLLSGSLAGHGSVHALRHCIHLLDSGAVVRVGVDTHIHQRAELKRDTEESRFILRRKL